MPTDRDLERQIDTLYQRPLTEFTAARNALAKGLPAPDTARVKTLVKPAIVPWLINQVYWQARSVFDRMIDAGDAVRRAQITAIEKPGTTPARIQQARARVREAGNQHRKAVADAVQQALRIASQHQLHPPSDVLARMLESLSLAAAPTCRPGRWTSVAQPAGFGALLGAAVPSAQSPFLSAVRSAGGSAPEAPVLSLAERRAAADAARAREAAERDRQRQLLAEARAAERAARQRAEITGRAEREAEQALDRARAAHADALRALDKTRDMLNRRIEGDPAGHSDWS